MYGNERYNDSAHAATAKNGSGELGRHIAGLGAVAMLVGIAIAIHAWLPAGWERTTLIMAVSGVAVWVLAAFALHLGSECVLLLGMLFPTLIFLTVLVVVLGLAQSDFPEGYERLDQPTARVVHLER